jgi:predicted dehydrogenase
VALRVAIESQEVFIMNKSNRQVKGVSSRREFLKTSALIAGGAAAAGLPGIPAVYAAGGDSIRVGVIGCGGRGTGAAKDVVDADPSVRIYSMGDAFKDRLDDSRTELKKVIGDKLDVSEDRCFVGFDAYEKVLASGVDYVILATPPGFRPMHLKAAVAAGKTVFTEKPVAVDTPGVRACLEVYAQALAKGIGIGAGTQYRHSDIHQETIRRLHQGAIGKIVSARCYFNTGSLWVHPRQPGWTEMEYQMRNWYYFTWLCGDHIVEQHIHNLDVVNWALGAHPVRAVGVGGRQVRTGADFGQIYDHFAIDYEYEDGARLMSMCRQMPNCENHVGEDFAGSQGFCEIVPYRKHVITGENPWTFAGEPNKPYIQEHADLIASVRAGKPINELKNVTESTLTAIMGRMAAYTGKAVTWEQALNSEENLMPAKLEWDAPLAVAPVAMPGQTPLV